MKTVETCFFFYASSLRFLSDESPKQSDQNRVMESKQKFFRGSHQFWMMSDEFWIISSKTPFIQTTPESLTNYQEFWKKPSMQTIRVRSFKRFDGPQGNLDLKISDRKVKLLDGFFKQKSRPSRNGPVSFRSTSFLCTKKLKESFSDNFNNHLLIMNPLFQMGFYTVNSISFPSYQGGGVEKGCVSISMNSPVIPRFHGPELGFLV